MEVARDATTARRSRTPLLRLAGRGDAEPRPGDARVPDRWLAAVLFTDIVDSTGQAVRLGDGRWLELAAAHEGLVRDEVRRCRGRVVSAAGDGAVALFPSPAAGIRCAAAIVSGTRALGLEVRAGLHAGECERRGGRVGGIVFHIGARVAALADAGEVLVSHTVKDLVAGSGLAFTPRGVRRLRGVPGRWPVYAAAEAGC
jgi:class 3 adenylate cyclase